MREFECAVDILRKESKSKPVIKSVGMKNCPGRVFVFYALQQGIAFQREGPGPGCSSGAAASIRLATTRFGTKAGSPNSASPVICLIVAKLRKDLRTTAKVPDSISLDGQQNETPFSTLLHRPDLRHVGSNLSPYSDLYVTVQLWAESKPLTVPVQTSYKAFKNERRWNEWLTLPITYTDLPLSSQLAITVWDLSPTGGDGARGHAIPFGGTTLALFDAENQLQKGRQKCHLHRRKAADGLDSTTTPSVLSAYKRHRGKGREDIKVVDKEEEEMDRLEKLLKKQEMGDIPKVEWLDQLVFRGSEKRRHLTSNPSKHLDRARSRQQDDTILTLDGKGGTETNGAKENGDSSQNSVDDERFTLFVELPRFDFPIVFADHEYPPPPISQLQNTSLSQSNLILRPTPEVHYGPGINGLADDDDHGLGGRLVRVYDPEIGQKENWVESKYRRLIRSHRTGAMDRDMKPNARVRDDLNAILAYSPTRVLVANEKDLIWTYRHHLTRDKRALTKFVKSVNWADTGGEIREAVQMLSRWTEIDVDDALELLGPNFDNPAVRAFAVDRLRKSDDDDLLLYLLQLVQALKFERISPEADPSQDSSLARFLITRATHNFMLGNYFHWYLMVECDDTSDEQSPEHRKLFAKVEYDFMTELVKLPNGEETRRVLLRQAELVAVLSKISGDVKLSREAIPRKVERVKAFVADPKNELVTIDPPLPLFIDPSIMVTGVSPSETLVFKSSLSPIMLTFNTTNKQKHQILFKTGDDLRQDQLMIQIIQLMDQLLRKENLDLKLSPYKILATGATAGAVQFVPSMTLQGIVNKYNGNTVLNYLKYNNPDDKAPLGVRKEALDTFVKSCAGYCVITYLLGVGDRHLDNLLLAPDGHFFHADFGYILGRDPKPFPPAMKLCAEMIDGMGGSSSDQYKQFKQYCYTAFNSLRKHSNLILNLFSLMVDANIQDIKLEPDRVVFKVKDRFQLELSDEEAIRYFDTLIEDSSNAFLPVIVDRLHGFVQNWRA
ncbi:Protein kinase-like (PK-like) [Glarea lozoyensis ATCC 20868]|uniref:Phosphatidylinositol 3-kinase VPS34 n=1 Tax=Glarea lozoyensis (strain ATCC 20868 / MF5171) TaxID=1116229 RepID=S3DB91_GLAL2|nr:Protein kinase-like (PK-like) [Glarea lozoyensis ATCC 20868]EPE35015.1 Protein kinase-like (PK-like) [Glarea lozoyensis ATCC 20868]